METNETKSDEIQKNEIKTKVEEKLVADDGIIFMRYGRGSTPEGLE